MAKLASKDEVSLGVVISRSIFQGRGHLFLKLDLPEHFYLHRVEGFLILLCRHTFAQVTLLHDVSEVDISFPLVRSIKLPFSF